MKKYPAQPLDLMQFINSKYHEPFIHEKIEFTEPLNAERLIVAIIKLADVFPILKCRYDFGKNEFIENEHFSVHSLFFADGDESALQDILTESLDTNKVLIKFTLSGNCLVVTASHLICDGNGFKQLLYLFCDFYNGKDTGEYDALMNRNFSEIFAGCGVKTSMLKMMAAALGGYKNRKIYEKSESENVSVVERTIGQKTMAAVYKKAKSQGATLNDVFMTAYARAQHKLYGREKVNVPCTSDLRKYAQKEVGIANLTGTLNLNIKIKEVEPFTKTLSAASAAMRKQKASGNDIAGPALLVRKYETTALEKFLKMYGGMSTSPFCDYSNLGVIDEKRLAFDGTQVINAVGYGGLQKAPYFMLAVSSWQGATTFSSIVQCGETEKEKIEGLFDVLVDEIKAFSEGITKF